MDEIGNAVRNTCILATVRFKALGLNRTDRLASRDVERDAGAVSGAARVVVSRLPGADEHHKAITKAQTQLRAALVQYSMPYGNDDGWRLLPNVNWEKLLLAYGAAKKEFDKAMAAFLADLPNVVAKAQANAGTLNVDIPTEAELRSAYGIEMEMRDIAAGNFPGLPPSTAAKLQQHVAKKLEAAVDQAMQDSLERVRGPLEYFVERMNLFEQREQDIAAGKDVGRNGVFRDSVLTNIHDLIGVIDSFNVVGDERLAVLSSKLKPLAEVTPETLRDSQPRREEITKVASNVLADLNDWLNPLPSAA